MRLLGRTGRLVSPIGMADAGLRVAKGPVYEVYKEGWQRGVNLFLWTPAFKEMTRFLLDLPLEERKKLFIVCGTGAGGPQHIHKVARNYLKILGVDALPSFMLFWVRSRFRVRDSVLEAVTSLRETGLCENIGISTHQRKMAFELYQRGIFDLFMLRYNAAHRGLEKDFLDRLDPQRPPGVITYTATRWLKLLKRPPRWTEDLPRPGDLYRFQLSHPRVTTTWMGAKTWQQLDDNLRVLSEGPLKPEEMAFLLRFGDRVHSMKTPLLGNLFEKSARM